MIWSTILRFAARDLMIRKRSNSPRANEDKISIARTRLARDLTNELLLLGPTFIKLGQLMSTRIDLFPGGAGHTRVLL